MKSIFITIGVCLLFTFGFGQTVDILKKQLENKKWGELNNDTLELSTNPVYGSIIEFKTGGCYTNEECVLYMALDVEVEDPETGEPIIASITCSPNYVYCDYIDNKYKFHTVDNTGWSITYISIHNNILEIEIVSKKDGTKIERYRLIK